MAKIDPKQIEEWKALAERRAAVRYCSRCGHPMEHFADEDVWHCHFHGSAEVEYGDDVPRPEPDPLAAAVPALFAEREEALAVLREVEWGGTENGAAVCPSCGGYHEDPPGDLGFYGARRGHAPDCRLAALLKGG